MGPSFLFIIAIIELVAKYGVAGVVSIIKAWQTDHPMINQADIERLRKMVPDPTTYFEEKNHGDG